MTGRRRMRRIAAALLAAWFAGAAVATEVHVQAVWIEPGQPAGRGASVLAPLNLPEGWVAGRAAVIAVSDGDLRVERARGRLVAALTGEDAAVLELGVATARGVAAGSASADPEAQGQEEDVLPYLFGALLALRRDVGAGLVVALGYGRGGELALLAASGEVAARHLGPDGPRMAAAGAMGPGPVRLAAGAAPPTEERWPERAALLCQALLSAVAAAPEAFLHDCPAALVGSAVSGAEPRFRRAGAR